MGTIKKSILFFWMVVHASPDSASQNVPDLPYGQRVTGQQPAENCQNVRVMFYNVENLYDPYDDSTTLDDDFTPGGALHWTYGRFMAKVNRLAKTILAVGEGDPPAIVGMCEVENRYVLNRLVYQSPLKPFQYRVIHHDSPDRRGVDVAMIYLPGIFRPVSFTFRSVHFPSDTLAVTRDILYVKGILPGRDTIHLFINHWPSRRGGEEESAPRRMTAAQTLRSMTDSLLSGCPESLILIMGDLNDEPLCESLTKGLNVRCMDTVAGGLVNLMCPMTKRWTTGTIKYRGRWSLFDQFIVSSAMVRGSGSLYTSFSDVRIFNGKFLLHPDERYLGTRLNRTYSGPRYTGGYSDHLPVYLDIRIKK